MNETLKTIFGLIGGLALFLYGMNNMSAALQKAAGDRMKQILGILTKNAVLGAIAGALVTAVLQSSSATTVMAIGFVSAGLMTLPQAISVIFGANIGTTMTAQLMAFKISNYIYPIIFIGFLLGFVGKKEKTKNIGAVIFSFGLLFEGIEIMGSVMKPLASSPVFTDLMGKVTGIPVFGVLLGAGMTLLVQSSSATIAVLQNFASQPMADGVTSVIGLTGAIPILLGDNIGTTITAILASIGQSKNAKRTAAAHSIFNISGSIVFLFLIPWFARFVRYISPSGPEVEVISRQIANAHTCFNIVCTLVWIPLLPVMVKIVTTLIPGEDRESSDLAAPKYLDERVLGQPAAALYLVTQEISRCAESTKALLVSTGAALDAGMHPAAALAQESFAGDYEAIKHLESQISHYITTLFSGGSLTDQQSEQAAGLLYVSNNIERIADRCSEISQAARRMSEHGQSLSPAATAELSACFTEASGLFAAAITAVEKGNSEEAKTVAGGRDNLRRAERRFSREHLKRLKKQEKAADLDLTSDFSGILYNLERIADNCAMVAEEAMDDLSFKDLAISAEGAQS